jgi:hypothetical protein
MLGEEFFGFGDDGGYDALTDVVAVAWFAASGDQQGIVGAGR